MRRKARGVALAERCSRAPCTAAELKTVCFDQGGCPSTTTDYLSPPPIVAKPR